MKKLEWLKVKLQDRVKFMFFENEVKLFDFIDNLQEDEKFHSEILEILQDSLEVA